MIATSKRKFLILAVFISLLYSPQSISAQDYSDDSQWERYDLEYRTFRLTIVPGIGTNGINAVDYASKYSLNLLGGYNGALHEGFELGILINANKYYATGVQIAGIGNYSGDNTAGVQLAGIGNVSNKNMQGIQLSGIGNWASSDMQGLQLSGIFNLSGGSIQGLQTAGAFNIAQNDMQGLLVSGIGNISDGDIQGLLLGGFFNIARHDMQGITISGGLNYSEIFQGISLGTANISQNFQGIQVGTANIVDQGQGIQVGLINYANEFEGLPVGLISYYRNGRQNFDLWVSETGFTNIGLKLGTEKIYNMPSVGFNPTIGRDVWQIGWSIGRLHKYPTHELYSDFSYFKINEGNWTRDVNSILKYRILFGKEWGESLKLYGGPTLNMLISRFAESDDYAPYRLFDIEAKGRQYVFWIGASLGIELF